jgi:DNA-binding PadR family transcriptional regulator
MAKQLIPMIKPKITNIFSKLAFFQGKMTVTQLMRFVVDFSFYFFQFICICLFIVLLLYYTRCLLQVYKNMNKNNLLSDLLSAWEETYKKGQLTLWIFISLRDGHKYVDEIKSFVEEHSNHTMTCETQSLYRNLRKYQHIGVVDFETGEGYKGPERKYYYLTDLGKELLNRFVLRNINIFFGQKIKCLLNPEE